MGEPVSNMVQETCKGEPEENVVEKTSPENSSPTQEPPPPSPSKLVKVDNWGSFFLQQLYSLYLNKEDCDFTLQFHDGNKLHVHRNVLNACTEFFKTLNIDGSNVLLPVEFSFEAFNAIINFMYTGRLEYTDDICENMYSIAKILKMAVLVKLLDAQSQNQENNSVGSTVTKQMEKRVYSPLSLANLGKTTKVLKKVSANGKKSIKLLSTNTPTLPGKKLPIWKKRTRPLPITPFFTSNGLIKRNILDPAIPVRFEWPDSSVEPIVMQDEFTDLSYDSKPLLKPNRGELQYTSAEDFDSKVNSVLKKSFTGGIDEPFEKRPRFESPGDQLYSSVENSITMDSSTRMDTSSSFNNNGCQIVTTHDDDSSDDDNHNDDNHNDDCHNDKGNGNDLSKDTFFASRSNSCESNVPLQVPSPAPTPKPILKTVGTPSSSKKVRFSLEEKENAASLEDQNFISLESVKTGSVIKQSNDVFSVKPNSGDSVSVVNKSAIRPASEKEDTFLKKRTVGAKLSVSKNTTKGSKLMSKSQSIGTDKVETLATPKIDNSSKDIKSVEMSTAVQTEVIKTMKHEIPSLEVSPNAKVVNSVKPSTNTISNLKQVSPNVSVPGEKAVASNHAKIVAEVLKKYPHLFNKNVRLKIMNPDGNKKSITNIKINCPGNQSSTKTAKNAQFSVANVTKKNVGGSAETVKAASIKDPCKGPWLCSSCGTDGKPQNFESYFLYHKHLQKIHNEKIDSRVCEHCGKKCMKRNLLYYHLLTEHKIPPPRDLVFPKCDQCDYHALSETLLIKHRKSNAHRSDFECKVCNAKFKSSGALQGHMQTKLHLNEPPKVYKCPHCDQEFSRNINVKAHIRNVHKQPPEAKPVSNHDQLYSNVLIEQQIREEDKECTLVLPPGVTLVADTQQVPLLPSSESEALNNVASGIATSIGLNDSLVNGETVILLDQGDYFLQNTTSQGEYIVPEILSNSNQIYTFPQKDQLAQVTTIANLCSSVPTSVGQLITEDTIVTIDNDPNNFNTQYNMPISLAKKLSDRDSNQLILFTLSGSDSAQKLSNQNAQNIIVTQASDIIPVAPTYSGETSLPTKLPDVNFEGKMNFEVSPHFENHNPETVETTQEQNIEISQSENLLSSRSQVEISNVHSDSDHCNTDCVIEHSEINSTEFVPLQEKNGDSLSKSNIKTNTNQMKELVQEWDEFSDEEREVEFEDDGNVSNMPCRPTFGPSVNDSFSL